MAQANRVPNPTRARITGAPSSTYTNLAGAMRAAFIGALPSAPIWPSPVCSGTPDLDDQADCLKGVLILGDGIPRNVSGLDRRPTTARVWDPVCILRPSADTVLLIGRRS